MNQQEDFSRALKMLDRVASIQRINENEYAKEQARLRQMEKQYEQR
jgi:hypothetical protein